MAQRSKILIAAAVAAVVVIAGGLWWFFGGDTPDEVSIDQAVQAAGGSVSGATGATGPEGGTDEGTDEGTDVGAEEGAEGDWFVQPGDGTESGSFVGFRIKEELATIGATEAVGRTGDVSGTVTITDGSLTAVRVEADLRSLRTDDSRRDGKVQQALETNEFPTAVFELTEPVDLGADPTAGVTVTARGELTIHGTTRAVEVPLDARLVDGRVAVVGSLEVLFSDYGVEVPSAPIVLSVEDRGVVELQLILVRD